MDKYKDIINLPHHTSKKYPRMSIEKRAAQFAPFAALTGYSEAIKEAARINDNKIEIDESLKQILNDKMKDSYNKKTKITITYFIKDKNKNGGKYIKEYGAIKKIDSCKKQMILENNKKIPIDEIINIEEVEERYEKWCFKLYKLFEQ